MTSPQYTQEIPGLGPLPWSEMFKDRASSPRCGSLRFEMYFYPRQEVDLGDIAFTKSQIRGFLEANQGIRIYRDNFRVMPYGQPNGEGDWLRLGIRRTQSPAGVSQGDKSGGWRVGYNQVVGAVFISRDKNPDLIDQTNREGIVEGVAFYDLKTFAEAAVVWFEHRREEFARARKETTEYDRALTTANQAAQDAVVSADVLKKTVKRAERMVKSAQKQGVPPDAEKISGLLNDVVDLVNTTVVTAQRSQTRFAEACPRKGRRV